jgi:hypothetical protein
MEETQAAFGSASSVPPGEVLAPTSAPITAPRCLTGHAR